MFAAGETVAVVRRSPGGVDQYGDPVTGTESRVEHDDVGVADGQASGTFAEPVLSGHTGPLVSDYLLFFPPGADVLATDVVEVRGVECEVMGRPFEWVNPLTGSDFGVVVRANRGEG